MADEWELSKENVQPLKQGRKVSTLNSVLHDKDGDTQKLLQEQRAVFETEIRSYCGDDPLDPWYRYVSWVEQAFPKGGKEGKIHVLLEKCITRFKDNKEAFEDPRFLEVWLKYAKMSSTPVEVYSYMYNNGICTQQAGLYDAWAWLLETQGNYKAAESVYGKGVDALTDTEAKAGLNQRKQCFEMRVAKRLNGEEISQDEIYEQEQRCALGRLRGEGKHGKVGSVRVGTGVVTSSKPGVLRPSTQVDRLALKPSNNAGGIAIFQDEPAGSSSQSRQPSASSSRSRQHTNAAAAVGQENAAPRTATSGIPSIPSRADHKENVLAAGQWNESAGKVKKSINVPLNKIGEMAPRAGFTLHQDEGSEEDQRKGSTVTPHKLQPGESNVLSTKKPEKDVSIALALFEPYDPTKKPMYCKNLVYQGTTEFSFEELRAMKWRTRQKKKKEEQEIEQRRVELLERERMLKEREEAMTKQMDEMKQLMLQQQQLAQQQLLAQQQQLAQQPQPQKIQPPGVRVIRPSTTSVGSASTSFNSNQPSPLNTPGRSTSIGNGGANTSARLNSMDDTQRLLNINPATGKMSTSSGSSGSISGAAGKVITPSPHRNHHGGMLGGNCRPSPTVNTKAAMAVMQQLWANSTSADGDDVFMPEPPKFEIFSDAAAEESTSGPPATAVSSAPVVDHVERISLSSVAKKGKSALFAEKAASGFPIFEDNVEVPEVAAKSQPAFSIFSDEQLAEDNKQSAAAPFQIFSDETSVGEPIKKAAAAATPFTIHSDSENQQEDKENIPLTDYESACKVARPRFGVLQPVQGEPCMPLEEQEKMLDEEERQGRSGCLEDEDGFTRPLAPPPSGSNSLQPSSGLGGAGNVTMFVPNETMFEKMAAKCASTPFRGGGYIPDEDEDTCAIQLFDSNAATTAISAANGAIDGMAAADNNEKMLPPRPVSPVQSSSEDFTGFGGPPAMMPLSPIVEVSQECYRSSSSSSGADTTGHHRTGGAFQEFSKSHWGNTGLSMHVQRTLGADSTAATSGHISLGSVRTPGAGLGSLTANSGYAGDKSSMTTMSTTSQSHQKLLPAASSRSRFGSTKSTSEDEQAKMTDDDDEENTGMLGMLSEFKQALAVKKPETVELTNPTPVPTSIKTSGQNSLSASQLQRSKQQLMMERSYQPSLLGEDSRVMLDTSSATGNPQNHLSIKPTPTKLQFNGMDETTHHGLTATSRPQLDMTGGERSMMRSHLSVTSGKISPNLVPSLELTGHERSQAPRERVNLEMTGHESSMAQYGRVNLEMTKHDNSLSQHGRINLEMTSYEPSMAQRGRGNLEYSLELTRHDGIDMTRPDINNLEEMTKPGGLELTRAEQPNLELTKGGPSGHLELTKGGPSQLELTTHHMSRLEMQSLNLTRPDPNMSASIIIGSSPSLMISSAFAPVPVQGISADQSVDPFTTEFQELILSQVQPPIDQRHGYVKCEGPLPQVRVNGMIEVGDDKFFIKSLKGEGGFAKVFSAIREDDDMNCTIAGIDAVLKVQKPANEWEWYICTEVQQRLRSSVYSLMAPSFMAIPRNYNFSNGGIFVSYHQKLGTLLDVANRLKTASMDGRELMAAAIYFAIEILYLVEALHSLGILHADIKPDNFLLQRIPEIPRTAAKTAADIFKPGNLCLQLIDFGKAIDMSILPENISFDKVVKTDGLYCAPMREKSSWREHIDYYGIAASVYCVLFGQYMDIVKLKSGVWEEKGQYKRSWTSQQLFKDFFREFINIKSLEKASLPSLKQWREKFTDKFINSMAYIHLKFDHQF